VQASHPAPQGVALLPGHRRERVLGRELDVAIQVRGRRGEQAELGADAGAIAQLAGRVRREQQDAVAAAERALEAGAGRSASGSRAFAPGFRVARPRAAMPA
jgi:hypothetical protein